MTAYAIASPRNIFSCQAGDAFTFCHQFAIPFTPDCNPASIVAATASIMCSRFISNQNPYANPRSLFSLSFSLSLSFFFVFFSFVVCLSAFSPALCLVVYYPAACGRSATRVPPPCHPGPVIFIHPWDMLILRAVTNFIRTMVT
jgi:hypothetical protein